MNRSLGHFALPTQYLPPPRVRDFQNRRSTGGPSSAPGSSPQAWGSPSGEFILWPYIASQVGLVFLWGAVVGLATQWFLNMEIERYTLATGETAPT